MNKTKKKSAFGLLVALGTAAYAAYYYCLMNGYIGGSYSGGSDAGYAFGMILVNAVMKDFVTFTIVAAAIALLSYFAGFRLGYLGAAVCLVIAYLQLPSTASPTSELALLLWLLCILLVVAFAIESSNQNKKEIQAGNAEKTNVSQQNKEEEETK